MPNEKMSKTADESKTTGKTVEISVLKLKHSYSVRWREDGHFIGHIPGAVMGYWSGRKFDPPDYWMPFPGAPED